MLIYRYGGNEKILIIHSLIMWVSSHPAVSWIWRGRWIVWSW